VRTVVAHEPPILELLDDPQAWDARFAAIADTYAERGLAAAMAQFAAAVGLPPPADPGGPAGTDPVVARAVDNRRFFYAHEFRQYPALHPDLPTLAAVADRIMPAAGRTSGGHDALIAATYRLGVRLGRPVAELPGGHGGFAEHPAEFAAGLDALLRGHVPDPAYKARNDGLKGCTGAA
jgi:hypothetical protein